MPALYRFLDEPVLSAHAAMLGAGAVKSAVDGILREARATLLRDEAVCAPPFEALVAAVDVRLAREASESLVEVLNGTGILLHTNLGRAPLAPRALAAVNAIAGGYSNLEFDLETGARGSRYSRLRSLLRATTGAEDSLVVNNCAAAVLLILDTFAGPAPRMSGREVIVSRNQLIEIGGGFRLPDVLARSGAKLVEVGATNKVFLRDFERALTANTALLLRSHTSNYRIEGFTADVEPAAFAALGTRAGIPTVEDLGGGALVDLAAFGLASERTVPQAVADGIDLVAFSGDKLLGGPQAGIIAGRAGAIARLRANPLLRALRVDKGTLAALGATLQLYLEPGGMLEIPFYAMLSATQHGLRERALRICANLREACETATPEAVATTAFAGGGAAPLTGIPSAGIAVRSQFAGPNALASRLRRGRPRVAGRVENDSYLLDLRTIPEAREAELVSALRVALS